MKFFPVIPSAGLGFGRKAKLERQENAAMSPLSDPAELDALANDKNEFIRASVAQNPSTPGPIIAKLAKDEVRGVRWGAISNPSIPSEVLAEIATRPNEDKNVLRSAAENLACEPLTLELLAKMGSLFVQRGVAANPNCPPELLEHLSLVVDEDSLLQYRVAGNPNSSAQTLTRLSQHTLAIIRQGVAGNRNTPMDVRQRLENDPEQSVRRAAIAHHTHDFEQANRAISDGVMPNETMLRRLQTGAQFGIPEAKEAMDTYYAAAALRAREPHREAEPSLSLA